MAMIKKTGLLCALMLLATTFNSHTMEPISEEPTWHGYVAYVGNVLLGYVQFNPEDIPESQLSIDVQSKIKILLHRIITTNDLKNCTIAINKLAQINDDLADLINNPIFCLHLIKHLSQCFICSNQQAAGALQTQPEAQKRLEIQRQFLNVCRQEHFDVKQFNLLYEKYKQYVDLNFTFSIIVPHGSYDEIIDMTLLMFAAMNNNCALIKSLLDNGAKINTITFHGNTALMFAVILGNEDAVTCLLNHPDIAINHQNNTGNTALLMALSKGNKLIIKLLLKKGADPEIANNNGLSPLELARQNGDQEIINKITKAILKKRSISPAKAA